MKKAKFQFIYNHTNEHSISTMCRVLEVTRQGYYKWLTRPESAHDIRDRELTKLISDEYETSRHIYGAPKLHIRLLTLGIHTSRKRIARLMRENGWRGVTRACAKRPTGEKRVSKSDASQDLIKRNFEADGPNKAWFADITYVKTKQGWLYLAVVIDIWSRMVVGWSMGPNITAELADDALKMAIARRRPPAGCCHHSDHGSQYSSLLLGKTMKEFDIKPSMGSISSPWDNAPTESFMGILKSECIQAKIFENREIAAIEIFDYIECFYNRLRIHSSLGWLSPAEFEKKYDKESRTGAA